MSAEGCPPAIRMSPFPLEILAEIVSALPFTELTHLLRVNSFFHSATVDKVYERVPDVALRRGRHVRPPLKNAAYAAHVRVLNVSIMAKRCCQPRALVLPRMEVLRLDIPEHTQHIALPKPWDRGCRGGWGTGSHCHARLPPSLYARTVVFCFPLGAGMGRRVSLVSPPDRLIMFLSMPSSVFDMEPLPLLLQKELPPDTRALTLMLACPRQPRLLVDVMHAVFQLADFVADVTFSIDYPYLRDLTVVIPDLVFNKGCRDVVQKEAERLMRRLADGANPAPTLTLQLASEFLYTRENELVLTERERDAYWLKSRPRKHCKSGRDVRHAVAQARRLGELAGVVWNTLVDNYDELKGEESEEQIVGAAEGK